METAIQSSVYVSSPEFAGWLTKRGFHWRKLWKKKWVALHGNEIVYMDKEPTLENNATLGMTKAQITAGTEIISDDIEGNIAGFAIQINDGHSPTWYLRAESEREKKSWILRLSYIHAIMRWLGDFEKVRVLGVGGTGIVYELLHCSNGSRFAMKEMDIKNAHQMAMAVSEAEMLKDIMEHVSHPNVMHIEKVFQVGSKFYLVFPLCTGGELYEHIIRRGHFTEHDAAVIIRDLISGLHALHAHDILHLDIKPENILFDSMDDDAKIKITDFGLSKIFYTDPADLVPGGAVSPVRECDRPSDRQSTARPSTASVRPSKRFSMDLMGQKMKAFLDSSELNIDRLKGTIGYMSPELILTGYCTKATDVFAAGVVLYILLCGRPPFHSKSNREVLEKTVRGTFKLSGHEWQEVSDDAKDLVRKMLLTNPEQRITTGEILEHPWIKQLSAEEEAPTTVARPHTPPLITGLTHSPSVLLTKGKSPIDAAKIGISLDIQPSVKAATTPLKAASSESLPSPVGKKQTANLSGALRLLSGHVKHLQSEKLATSVTRLVSQMQQGSSGGNSGSNSSLSNQYLVPVDSNKSEVKPEGDAQTAEDVRQRDDQDIMMLMNSDLRSALTAAIDNLGAVPGSGEKDDSGNDKNSSTILSSYNSGQTSGKLTIEQFLVILKHFGFTPAGANGQNGGNKSSVGALLFCRFLDRDGDGYISVDDISTAQALIMQRNDLFLKMIFRLYVESLWYPGRNMNVMHIIQSTPLRGNDNNSNLVDSGVSTPSSKKVMTENNLPVDVVEPPKVITARHAAAVFEKLGYDPASGQKVFTTLCETISRLKANSSNGNSGNNSKATTPHHTTRCLNNSDDNVTDGDCSHPSHSSNGVDSEGNVVRHSTDGSSRGSSDYENSLSISPNSSATGGPPPLPPPLPNSTQAAAGPIMSKMDYADFVKAIEIDDVFLQVIFRKPRSKLISVVRRASGSFKSPDTNSNDDSGTNTYSNRTASVIESELKEAFKNLKVQNDNSSTPQANKPQSVFQKGMGTISAAFGLAAKFTSAGAAALFDSNVNEGYDDCDEEDESEKEAAYAAAAKQRQMDNV